MNSIPDDQTKFLNTEGFVALTTDVNPPPRPPHHQLSAHDGYEWSAPPQASFSGSVTPPSPVRDGWVDASDRSLLPFPGVGFKKKPPPPQLHRGHCDDLQIPGEERRPRARCPTSGARQQRTDHTDDGKGFLFDSQQRPPALDRGPTFFHGPNIPSFQPTPHP